MNKIQRIIQGLYGISESEQMMPRESARFTLNKTVECLELALEEHDKEIRAKAIDEFVATLVPRLTDAIYQKDVEGMTNLINGVAEELKAGVEDE